jgi:XTP/dITP diphosphohydrolase
MKLGFVTSNDGKLLELQRRLIPLGYEVEQVRIEYPEIQADTIDEVSKFGLRWIINEFKNHRLKNDSDLIKKDIDLVMVEDSGLFVHGLNNFPGVYSKFVFRTIGYSGVLNLLSTGFDRSAHFESCIGLADLKQLIIPDIDLDNGAQDTAPIDNRPDAILLFKGVVNGTIITEPRGDKGFGYDPIFQPQGAEKTFAEMIPEEKNNYSHRGSAMNKLIEFLSVNKAQAE